MISKPGRMSVADASLIETKALPADKSLSTATDAIDLGLLHGISERTSNTELVLTYPALALAKLPNTSVITYTLQASADSTFATGVRVIGQVTQTGATGTATQPGAQFRVRLPADCPQYLRAVAATDAAGADCSAASIELALAF